MTVAGLVNREVFQVFVAEVLCPTLRAGQVVIMDNLKVHHGDRMRQLIEAMGAGLVFLPPYSPELNPIEMYWPKLKAFIRRCETQTVEALEAVITQAFNSVTASDIHGWFAHCGYATLLK